MAEHHSPCFLHADAAEARRSVSTHPRGHLSWFQRLHERTKYPGTDIIGLAICMRLIERHGGRLIVEYNVGEGLTLWFSIPAQSAVGREASDNTAGHHKPK
jgi:hypothetical protein